MKSKLHRWSVLGILILIFTACLGASASVYADGISVNVDGEPVVFDAEPFFQNDRTMVPIRAIFEAFGANVEWDEASQTAVSTLGGTTVSIRLGSPEMTVSDSAGARTVALDAAAISVSDRTFVPVRAISEAFGAEVYWNEGKQLVEIGMDSRKVYFPEGERLYKTTYRVTSMPSVLLDGGAVYYGFPGDESLNKFENGAKYAYPLNGEAENLILYNGMIYLWEDPGTVGSTSSLRRINRDGSGLETLFTEDDAELGSYRIGFFICDNKAFYVGYDVGTIRAAVYDIATGDIESYSAKADFTSDDLDRDYRMADFLSAAVTDGSLYLNVTLDALEPEAMSYIVEISLGGGESETVSAYPTGAYVQEKLIGGGYNGRFAKSGGRIVNSENKVIAEELDKSGVESNILLNYDNDQAVYYYFEWTDAGSNYSRRYQMMSVINYDGTENNVLGVWDAYGIGAPSELPNLPGIPGSSSSGSGSGSGGNSNSGSSASSSRCLNCGGSGYLECTYCHGTGRATQAQIGIDGGIWEDDCPNCGGSGRRPCSLCHGSGQMP